jgi:glutathione synthase
VRPRTLVTRDRDRIRAFAESEETIVVKPLQGYGGRAVFVVRPENWTNLGEIIRAVTRDGYVVAQEYLPAAAEGDTRLFLMNGQPLRVGEHYAAFRRIRSGEDARSNLNAGGRLRRAKVDQSMLDLAEIVRPRLSEDGMFLVGLDIVGDKLIEINVFSPGGLGSAQMFEKVDFSEVVVAALERKVRSMGYYRRRFSNVELATL